MRAVVTSSELDQQSKLADREEADTLVHEDQVRLFKK
jgi:hypothetical protein